MPRQRSLVAATTVLAAALALTLASCSSHSDPPVPVRSDAVSISTPTTPSQTRTSTATPTPTPAAAFTVAHDRGPASGATGTVVANAAGVPVTYTVASGDTEGDVCHRLGVRWWQLMSGGQFLGTYPTLTVGEVIDVVDVPESAAGDTSSDNALC